MFSRRPPQRLSTDRATARPRHRDLATWAACLALLALGACGEGGDTGAASSDREPATSDPSDSLSPVESQFADLVAEHPGLADVASTAEQEYVGMLEQHEADLSRCSRPADGSGDACKKPTSLQGDLAKTVNVQLLLDASGSMAGLRT